MSGSTYVVIRMYENDDYTTEVIKRGLTLDQAQAHCNDPETSSSTCTNAEGLARTEARGRWFDGYEDESRYPRPVSPDYVMDGENRR